MKLVIGLYILAALFVGSVIFTFQKYLRIVVNLFLGISIRTTPWQADGEVGENVRFKSADGPELLGHLIRSRASGGAVGTVIFCHEFGSDGKSVLQYGDYLLAAGFDLFGFDFQGHGASACAARYEPRHWATNREVGDVLGAIEYLKGREDVRTDRLGLFGISRGGAAALAAAANDGAIKAVLCDSTFSTWATLNDYMRKWVSIYAYFPLIYRNLPKLIYTMLGYSALKLSQIRLGVRFVQLEDVLKRVDGATLFIHGERDTYINASQARYLVSLAKGESRSHVFAGAKHNGARFTDGELYEKLVTEFFHEHLVAGTPAGVSVQLRGS